jgi:hypothetical protein
VGLLTLAPAKPRAVAATARAQDRLLAGALGLALVTLTGLPYLYGYLVAGPERQFMGIVLNVPDTAQYFSWAREFGHAVLIENKLTPESGAAVYFNLFWWCIGRLSVASGIGIAETTQLVRPLVGTAYALAIYWVLGLVTHNRLERWTAFLVAAFGGGLGWLLVVGKQFTGVLGSPLDVYVTEANTFLTVMAFPHQAAAGALLILTLGLAACALERGSATTAALAGITGLLLGVQHGYDLLIVYAVVGCLGLALAVRGSGWWRTIGLGSLVCGPSLPAALYLAYLARESPIWRGVLAQYGNAGVYTPSPPHLVVLVGIPLLVVLTSIPFAIAQRRRIWLGLLRADAPQLLMWTWLVVGGVLLYVPTDFQIKMLACWQVPVAFAAARLIVGRYIPLVEASRLLGTRNFAAIAATAFVLLVLPVNAYLFAWRFVDLGRVDHPYFLTRDEVGGLQWLAAHSQPTDVVLSTLTIGQYVPSIAGNSAFLAHWAQTLDFYGKQRLVAQLFDPLSSEQDRNVPLDEFSVRYVFVDKVDHVDLPARLTAVYTSPGATVYKVRRET